MKRHMNSWIGAVTVLLDVDADVEAGTGPITGGIVEARDVHVGALGYQCYRVVGGDGRSTPGRRRHGLLMTEGLPEAGNFRPCKREACTRSRPSWTRCHVTIPHFPHSLQDSL